MLEIVNKLLTSDKIVFEKDSQSFVLTKVNDLVNLRIYEDVFEGSKITTKLISSNNYSKEELLIVINDLNIESYLKEKYQESLQKEAKIIEETNNFIDYLYKNDMSDEDRNLLFNVMYVVKYNGFINIGTDYGLTFVSPFTKEIKLYLINLKTGESCTNYDEIIQTISNLYHKNRVKFNKKVLTQNEIEGQFKIKR